MKTYGVDLVAYELRVRDALADLPAEETEELIQDLREHLAEINAEFPDGVDEQSLVDRLGLPEVYAGELRAAAGFEATYAQPKTRRPSFRERMSTRFQPLSERERSPRLREAMLYAQVGWWVLRGWLLGFALSMVFANREMMSPLPDLRTEEGWMGLVLLLGSVAMSIGFGVTMRKYRGQRQWWLLVVPVNVVAVLGLMFVAFGERPYYQPDVESTAQASEAIRGTMVGLNGMDITNIYAFDRTGKPIKEVFLFDQDGNPIELLRDSCPTNVAYEGGDEGDLQADNQFPRPRLRWTDDGKCQEDAAIPFTALIKPQAPSLTLTK